MAPAQIGARYWKISQGTASEIMPTDPSDRFRSVQIGVKGACDYTKGSASLWASEHLRSLQSARLRRDVETTIKARIPLSKCGEPTTAMHCTRIGLFGAKTKNE